MPNLRLFIVAKQGSALLRESGPLIGIPIKHRNGSSERRKKFNATWAKKKAAKAKGHRTRPLLLSRLSARRPCWVCFTAAPDNYRCAWWPATFQITRLSCREGREPTKQFASGSMPV